jgi:hypothetical protein
VSAIKDVYNVELDEENRLEPLNLIGAMVDTFV